MTSNPWHRHRMAGFDLETTGVSVHQGRILTASIVDVDPTRHPVVETSTIWLNPGIPIPPEATKVHGITDETAQERGLNPEDELPTLVHVLAAYLEKGIPLVGMNCPYDLTLLDRECRRHGAPTLTGALDPLPLAPIVDVLVLDKQVDRYRKGSRNLTALCEHYNVDLDGAHDSAHDALAAVRVAWRIANLHPQLQIDLHALHGYQMSWRAQQFASFQDYRRSRGQTVDGDGCWPVCHHTGGTDQ